MPRAESDFSTSHAEALAVSALTYVAADPERLQRFLALSGLDPARIRLAARQRGFLTSILEYVASDERLLLAFAESENIHPGQVPEALRRLGGGGQDYSP